MTVCTIGAAGSLNSCAAPSITFNMNGPAGIAIREGLAFVVNINSNKITTCQRDVFSGELLSCSVQGTTPTGGWLMPYPLGISIVNDFVYVPQNGGNNAITACQFDSDGVFTACSTAASGDPPLGNPSDIVII